MMGSHLPQEAPLNPLRVLSLFVAPGEASPESPYIYTGQFRDFALWALAEPVGPTDQRYVRETWRYLEEGLGQESPRALTTTLSSAIQSCHQQLQKSVPAPEEADWTDTAGVALSCVALRGQEAYLAQVGPALAYALQEGEVKRVVPSARGVRSAPALGRRAPIEVSFYRQQFQEGNRLLVAFTGLDGMLPLEGVAALLQGSPEETLRKTYMLTQDQAAFSAFLVYPGP